MLHHRYGSYPAEFCLPPFPQGLGNSSGHVGHNRMDHFTGTGAEAEFDGMEDEYYYGRKPIGSMSRASATFLPTRPVGLYTGIRLAG